MIQLEIFGRPKPCNSHHTSGKRFYNPKQKEITSAKWQVKSQFNQKPIPSATEIKVSYFFHVPKNTSYIKKKQMLANMIKHTSRPDTDNLTKFLKDVLSGIVFEDDKQVWHEDCRKLWCETEKDEKTLIYVMFDSDE